MVRAGQGNHRTRSFESDNALGSRTALFEASEHVLPAPDDIGDRPRNDLVAELVEVAAVVDVDGLTDRIEDLAQVVEVHPGGDQLATAKAVYVNLSREICKATDGRVYLSNTLHAFAARGEIRPVGPFKAPGKKVGQSPF